MSDLVSRLRVLADDSRKVYGLHAADCAAAMDEAADEIERSVGPEKTMKTDETPTAPVHAVALQPLQRELSSAEVADVLSALWQWHRDRESLSSDCQRLGISSGDGEKWRQELTRRCEPLRAFCQKLFYGR